MPLLYPSELYNRCKEEFNMPKKERVDVVRYRKKRIVIYLDERAQSFYFTYKGNIHYCGAYNIDYYTQAIDVIDADLDRVFYVRSELPNQPSARVYDRFGVWKMDYKEYDGLTVCLGDILPKPQRPTAEKVMEKAKYVMRSMDELENKDPEND